MFRVGIDIGGTFTDLVSFDEEKREIATIKVETTPEDRTKCVMDSLRRIASLKNITLQEFLKNTSVIVHGTTVATNAMLELKGARTALVTTKGFRDFLQMRRGHKEAPRYELKLPPPPQLIPRHLRIGIEERVDSRGNLLTELNEEELSKAAESFGKENIESAAICFLFSFINSRNERKALEILKSRFPQLYVSLSSEVLPIIGEYDRVSTTAVDAYIKPLVLRYLEKLESQLRSNGFRGEVLVAQSNGGVANIEEICRRPVTTVLSGPAAGPSAGVHYGLQNDIENAIIGDMGGTSFDVSVVRKGIVNLTTKGKIGRYHVSAPMLDIHTIGAGGGSIAFVDSGGVLQVGPQSAGAVPGPSCYGKGGSEPTVTDANLLLGYLNPSYFLGGAMQLHPDMAELAIKKKVADPLGIDLVEASRLILVIVNNKMADAIRTVTVQQGYDPKDFWLLAGGSATPAHIGMLASILGIRNAIVPKIPGHLCALGMLLTELKHDYIRTILSELSESSIEKIQALFDEMEDEARGVLAKESVKPEDMAFLRYLDMRYSGQMHEVTVYIGHGGNQKGGKGVEEIRNLFHDRHEELFGHCERTAGVEITNVRLTAIGKMSKVNFNETPFEGIDSSMAIKATRKIFLGRTGGAIETPVYDGTKLRHGNVIVGPGIIEEPHTTIVVNQGYEAKVNKFGDYIMRAQ